jgi:hypothetical protein
MIRFPAECQSRTALRARTKKLEETMTAFSEFTGVPVTFFDARGTRLSGEWS